MFRKEFYGSDRRIFEMFDCTEGRHNLIGVPKSRLFTVWCKTALLSMDRFSLHNRFQFGMKQAETGLQSVCFQFLPNVPAGLLVVYLCNCFFMPSMGINPFVYYCCRVCPFIRNSKSAVSSEILG